MSNDDVYKQKRPRKMERKYINNRTLINVPRESNIP